MYFKWRHTEIQVKDKYTKEDKTGTTLKEEQLAPNPELSRVGLLWLRVRDDQMNTLS